MKHVVTAIDASGRSYFATVSEASTQFASLWASAPGDPLAPAPSPATPAAAPLEPPPGSTTFRVFELPDDAVVAEYLRAQGASHGRAAAGGAQRGVSRAESDRQDASFHRTNTLDYVLILDGEITLELDAGAVTLGPGDCVVQRATNHAWRNKSGKPVRMAVVMIGLAK